MANIIAANSLIKINYSLFFVARATCNQTWLANSIYTYCCCSKF